MVNQWILNKARRKLYGKKGVYICLVTNIIGIIYCCLAHKDAFAIGGWVIASMWTLRYLDAHDVIDNIENDDRELERSRGIKL